MKNLSKSLLVAGALFCAAQSFAQSGVKRTAKDVGHTVGHAAKDVGHKTSEIAAKGESKILDKKYDAKCGPNGETVYIDKNSRYYYVTKRGHRVYKMKSQLMDKHHMKM